MTGEKFAEIVTKRANQRVNVKLRAFQQAIHKAFNALSGEQFISKSGEGARRANYDILSRIIEKELIGFEEGWPLLLWKKEEELVKDELLSMMDEMQKALLSPEAKEGDCKPVEIV